MIAGPRMNPTYCLINRLNSMETDFLKPFLVQDVVKWLFSLKSFESYRVVWRLFAPFGFLQNVMCSLFWQTQRRLCFVKVNTQVSHSQQGRSPCAQAKKFSTNKRSLCLKSKIKWLIMFMKNWEDCYRIDSCNKFSIWKESQFLLLGHNFGCN